MMSAPPLARKKTSDAVASQRFAPIVWPTSTKDYDSRCLALKGRGWQPAASQSRSRIWPLWSTILIMKNGPMPGLLDESSDRTVPPWTWWVAIFLISLVGLALFSGQRLQEPSGDTHFVYLANTYNSMIAATFSDDAAAQRADKVAFELDRNPPHRNDWASYWELNLDDGEQIRGNWLEQVGRGPFRLLGTEQEMHLDPGQVESSQRRYFVSFPPAPAWLMMPLAAVWGYGVHDVWFTLIFGALNILLLFLLLEVLAAGSITDRSRKDNLWLTLLFGFGTVHLWCAVLGQVWFTALIVGITFTLAYIICAIDARRPLLAGLFLALAFATRTPLVFSAIFFFAFLAFPGGKWIGRQREYWPVAAKKFVLFCLPCLAIGLSLLWMNHVRFNDWGEFGHALLLGGMVDHIQQYGLFHWNFLSENLTAAFTLLPNIQAEYPYIQISRHGMSLVLTTPAFLYLLWPRRAANDKERFLRRLIWATVAVVALPGFFYQNTGFEQFGYRFSLDYTVYLVALLALGRRPINGLFKAAILFGVAVNAFGAVIFKQMPQFFVGGRWDFFP